jgi:hypothetical protein
MSRAGDNPLVKGLTIKNELIAQLRKGKLPKMSSLPVVVRILYYILPFPTVHPWSVLCEEPFANHIRSSKHTPPGISRTIRRLLRYEFLSGRAFTFGSPVPLFGNAKTTRNNRVKNDNMMLLSLLCS